MADGIRKIFSEVSCSYELVNHVLTFGLDIYWRKKLAKTAKEGRGGRWLDICCGTGETAVNLLKNALPNTFVYGADFCESMIRVAAEKKEAGKIRFIIADAGKLPFKNNAFNLITISFATRNINVTRDILIDYLGEFHRVLDNGSRFINLETTQPVNSIIKTLFHLYVRSVVMPIGYLISGSKAGYKYLSHTIPRFYNADEFSDIIKTAGFSEVNYKRLALGLTAIHKAVK